MVTLGHVIPTQKKNSFERVIAPFLFCHQVVEFRHKQNPGQEISYRQSP